MHTRLWQMGFLTSYCIHASACFDFLDPGDVIFPPNYSRTGDRESFMHLRSLDPFCTPPYPQIGHHPLCFPFYIPLFSFHPHPHTSCSSVLYVLPCLRVGGVKISNPSYALPCANLVLLNNITHSTLTFPFPNSLTPPTGMAISPCFLIQKLFSTTSWQQTLI